MAKWYTICRNMSLHKSKGRSHFKIPKPAISNPKINQIQNNTMSKEPNNVQKITLPKQRVKNL